MSISVAELVGGIFSGSISLISDAIHNFSDVLTLIISYVAHKISKKEASEDRTFGYKRSEILAAFFNSATLIVLAFFIIYEAVIRFITPVEVIGDLVIYLALASIFVNGLSVFFIKKDAKANINMKSAYLHLLGDMMTSIAVLIGGLLMKYYEVYWIDPILSIVIAFYLIYISWGIFRTSLKIMMQFTPENIDVKIISKELCKIKGIKNIHHVHIWQINDHDIMFEAHTDLMHDVKISEFEQILEETKLILSHYDIHHVTLQPEFSVDDSKDIVIF